MKIALIAHDKKKELMVQFCTAYKSILAHHTLCATAITGQFVSSSTGLEIYNFMSGKRGGTQQIASRIAYDEIDLLLFFRDPLIQSPQYEEDEFNLLRLCDMHNVPVATNIATAEVLILALQRGDLAWRDIRREVKDMENFNDIIL